MIVDSGAIFMLTANKMTAMTRSNRRGLWSQSVEAGTALALAGKTLFVGSRDKVSAFNAANGKALWSGPVPGRALGLAVANGALLVSTDTGAIVSFGQASDQPSAWILY
jgi:outer membrane protein assembly factor BamB